MVIRSKWLCKSRSKGWWWWWWWQKEWIEGADDRERREGHQEPYFKFKFKHDNRRRKITQEVLSFLTCAALSSSGVGMDRSLTSSSAKALGGYDAHPANTMAPMVVSRNTLRDAAASNMVLSEEIGLGVDSERKAVEPWKRNKDSIVMMKHEERTTIETLVIMILLLSLLVCNRWNWWSKCATNEKSKNIHKKSFDLCGRRSESWMSSAQIRLLMRIPFAYIRSYMPLTHVLLPVCPFHHMFRTSSVGTQKGNVIVMTNWSRCFRLARLMRAGGLNFYIFGAHFWFPAEQLFLVVIQRRVKKGR